MKIRAYMRIAKDGYKYKVDAHTKDDTSPIYKVSSYRSKEFLPTVRFAVDFIIPDELFSEASRVIGEMNVALTDVKIAGQIPQISDLEIIED